MEPGSLGLLRVPETETCNCWGVGAILGLHCCYLGIMENKMENNMETAILGLRFRVRGLSWF